MNEWKQKIMQLRESRRDYARMVADLTSSRKKLQKAEIAAENRARPLTRLREVLFNETEPGVLLENKKDNGLR